MAQISYIIRSFVQSRLLDAETGFNFWLPAVVSDPDTGYPVVPTFQLVQGTNFFVGAFDADMIDESGNSSYPMCIVSSNRDANLNMVTPNEFSGVTLTIVDFYSGFFQPDPPADTESFGDAVEDAMYETFNRADYYGLLTGTGATYNNEMDMQRGPLQFAGDNWRQLHRFTLKHYVQSGGR